MDYALIHDMAEQAEKARQIVIKKHTFTHRVMQMLEILQYA